MNDFLIGVGLVLVIEGAFYAAVPTVAKLMMRQALAAKDNTLRLAGLGALAAGVALVWLAKS